MLWFKLNHVSKRGQWCILGHHVSATIILLTPSAVLIHPAFSNEIDWRQHLPPLLPSVLTWPIMRSAGWSSWHRKSAGSGNLSCWQKIHQVRNTSHTHENTSQKAIVSLFQLTISCTKAANKPGWEVSIIFITWILKLLYCVQHCWYEYQYLTPCNIGIILYKRFPWLSACDVSPLRQDWSLQGILNYSQVEFYLKNFWRDTTPVQYSLLFPCYRSFDMEYMYLPLMYITWHLGHDSRGEIVLTSIEIMA